MATLSETLRRKLERDPKGVANVIVMVRDNAAAHVAQVRARGLTVKHSFTLIPGFALAGAASAILALADEPWVKSIEEDKPVHTMR